MVTAVNSNYRTHTVKKNETLWSIAKRELGENATNNQIANYSNKIAKLNKLNTSKKRNTIFANDKLYLPEVSAAKNTSTVVSVKEVQNVVKTNAEKGFDKFSDRIANNKLRIEKADLDSFITLDMYHVYYTNNVGRQKLICTYTKDKKSNNVQFSFDGEKKIDSFGYDYVLTTNGNIYERRLYELGNPRYLTLQGKVSKSDIQKIVSTIEKQIPKKQKS